MRLLSLLLLLSISQAAFGVCAKPGHPAIDISAYYQSTQGLTGDNLKSALNLIIRDHTRFTYSCVWTILQEADEDPQNPANIIALYTNRSIPKADRDAGQNDPNSWNREHVWAKSHGFPNQTQHAYTDAHHLRPADRSVNTDRSDNDFDNGGVLDTECTECREGSGTWEPPDRVKGDIARMLFYMVVRYEGSDTSNTQDLELVDRTTDSGDSHLGTLCTLVQWHNDDSVSNEERNRNGIVYGWQGNRNPFIDHPEYVVSIWGGECEASNSTKNLILERIDTLESGLNGLREIVEESL